MAAANVPKIQLDLDDILDVSRGDDGLASPTRSMANASIRDEVDSEKCVLSQYRTDQHQKQAMIRLLAGCNREAIPIEWVIDIADESNGWFYATAYHYNDTTQMLHVMVPDKINPTFDGHVQLDHRTVHLIECVDLKSLALYNKIVRDSIIKIKWELEWFEEPDVDEGGDGGWINSVGRYYIRIFNQLLVEDRENGQERKGFVIITADSSVRFLNCMKSKGEDDFSRLINEGVVSSSQSAADFASAMLSAKKSPNPNARPDTTTSKKSMDFADESIEVTNSTSNGMKKLAEMSTGLKECVEDILEERSKRKTEVQSFASMFKSFALDGDLDSGLKLLDEFEAASRPEAGKMESIVVDAKFLSGKLEKSLLKALKGGSAAGDGEEVEQLKKTMKKMKKELDEKERELRSVKGKA